MSFCRLAAFFHWLTTTRYTRHLESELARLRHENAALRNSIYARAGVPPIEFADAACASAPANSSSVNARPQPIRRPMTWAQARSRLESLHRGPAKPVTTPTP